MFADPQSITVNAVPISLPAVSRSDTSSVYSSSDSTVQLKIQRQVKNRKRFNVRIDFKKVASDPFDTAKNAEFSGTVYLIMDMPHVGFTTVEVKDYALALAAWATSANLLKVLGHET